MGHGRRLGCVALDVFLSHWFGARGGRRRCSQWPGSASCWPAGLCSGRRETSSCPAVLRWRGNHPTVGRAREGRLGTARAPHSEHRRVGKETTSRWGRRGKQTEDSDTENIEYITNIHYIPVSFSALNTNRENITIANTS